MVQVYVEAPKDRTRTFTSAAKKLLRFTPGADTFSVGFTGTDTRGYKKKKRHKKRVVSHPTRRERTAKAVKQGEAWSSRYQVKRSCAEEGSSAPYGMHPFASMSTRRDQGRKHLR